MAERRMFAKTIIDSDAFLDMPLSTQALYFHLSMRADDDGFINNPKKIQRVIGCSDDDLKLLIAKRFIIPFDSGIVVIKHWRIHNYIRNDRYKETVYKEEKALLTMKENNAYTLATNGIPTVSQMDTQDRLGKDRLGKAIKESGFVFDDSVIETIKEFIKMRKQIKAPMTDRALQLLLWKLVSYSKDPGEQIAILNESIENSWKGIYPPKGKPKSKTAPSEEHNYDMEALRRRAKE